MRFVCDCCHDLTNIEADRMEIQGDKLIVYSRASWCTLRISARSCWRS